MEQAPVVQDDKRWWAMLFIAISQLMVVLDASIVNLALPTAKRDLGISDVDQQWVVTAYTLAFGGLLLLGGRIADYVGRKRAFVIGLLGFAGASLIGALAFSPLSLFAARALQGVFGALLAPAALSLVTVTFLDPKERAKAFGIFGAISGGGAAIGLLLGGVLTEYVSWRWCLAVNTPIAIFATIGALRFVRESKASGNTAYDIPGVITATLGLTSLVYGFTLAAPKVGQTSANWTETNTMVFLGAGAALLFAFITIERRVQNPLLPLRVPLERNRGGAYLSSLFTGAGLFSMFLFLGLYLQVIKGYSPVMAGLAFLPFSIGVALTAGVAANLLPKTGPRPLMVTGLIVAGLGMLWLSQIDATTPYVTHVLPSMLIISSGMAFVFIPTASTALHGVGSHDAGVASALINTSQQVGGSIGAALLNTVAVTATTSYLSTNSDLGSAGLPEALTRGYTNSFAVGSMLLFAAAIVVFVLIRIGRESLQEAQADAPAAHLG